MAMPVTTLAPGVQRKAIQMCLLLPGCLCPQSFILSIYLHHLFAIFNNHFFFQFLNKIIIYRPFSGSLVNITNICWGIN